MSKKERLFLDESRLDYRRKPNTKASAFLLESEGGLSYIEKCKKNPDLPLYLTGIIQSGDKPNRNNRIYPWEYLKRECLRYMDEKVKTGLSYCELNHPENSATPDLNNACATIEDIWFKGKDVYGRIKVLNAFMPETAPGKMVRGFILNGKNIGISSRALGSLQEDVSSQYDIVDEDLEIICWDLVDSASNFGSEKLELTERKQVKILTESQCFGGVCNVKPSEKILETLTESEKTYLNILGVEKFLILKSRYSNSK
jgi:hypothetical protein